MVCPCGGVVFEIEVCGRLLLLRAFEQDLNKDDISRLKGRHEALLASREALGKGASGGGGGEDFIPLDGKVFCIYLGGEEVNRASSMVE